MIGLLLGLWSMAAWGEIPLELPPEEPAAAWSRPASLADLVVGEAGACPWVRMSTVRNRWHIEVCDAAGEHREATIGRPTSAPEREAAILLAQSLLRPAGVALPGIPAAPPVEPVSRPMVPVEPPPEEPGPPLQPAGVRPTPEAERGDIDESEVVDLAARDRPFARRVLAEDPDEGFSTDLDGALTADATWSPWWALLGVGRVWDAVDPALGVRGRVGVRLPGAWRAGLEVQAGPARTVVHDDALSLHQASTSLGIWTPLLGESEAWLGGRLGLGVVRARYDGVDLPVLRAPLVESSVGLPIAQGRGWSVIAEAGGGVHLRGLELQWADGRRQALTVWQAEIALGVRVGRLQ